MPYGCPGSKGQGFNQKAKAGAGITDDNDAQVSRCFQAAGKGEGFIEIAVPKRSSGRSSPPAPTGTRRFNPYIPSERRRIVAQVRRKVPKNQGFLVVQDSLGRCDDLLTTGVDNADPAGL